MSSALLSSVDVDRLVKLLGRLGSDCDTERAFAGAKANELVRQNGLTWNDVITAPPPERPWHKMALRCEAHRHLFNARELTFINSMVGWRGELSAKQQAWLIDLFVRCGGTR
jgi:hypothetical protein